jgi:hypothetical protein
MTMERNSEICSRTENELALFVGGELEPNTRAAVRAHLGTCADCRAREHAAHRAHRALVRGLGATGRAGARPPALWNGVRAGLERDGLLRAPVPSAPAFAAASASAWTRRSTWWTAAAAALVLCSAWFVRQQFATHGDDTDSNIVVVPPRVMPVPDTTLTPIEALPVGTHTSPFEGVAAVTPYRGLRRLSADERSIAESAEPLPSEERSLLLIPSTNGGPSGGGQSNSAATLRRVRPWQ